MSPNYTAFSSQKEYLRAGEMAQPLQARFTTLGLDTCLRGKAELGDVSVNFEDLCLFSGTKVNLSIVVGACNPSAGEMETELSDCWPESGASLVNPSPVRHPASNQ